MADINNSLGNIGVLIGDYIPLAGTEIGSPVTGDIEISDYHKIFAISAVDLGNTENAIVFDDGNFFIRKSNTDSGLLNTLFIGDDSYNLDSNNPNFKGLVGSEVFDKQFDLKAYVQFGDLQESYIPLTGTLVDKPVTGNIEISNGYKIFNINEGEDQNSEFSFEDGKSVVRTVKPSEGYGTEIGTTSDSAFIISNFSECIGILGSNLFDKQNNPLAFVQLGDLVNGYIPLNGTLEGFPMNGNFRLANYTRFTADDSFENLESSFIEMSTSSLTLTVSSSISGTTSGLNIGSGGIELFASEDSKGLASNTDYSPNYSADLIENENVYVQKKYVQSLITSAGSGFIQITEKGASNGVVPLNSSSTIDPIYLPSYVDDVLEFNNLAAFPLTGETGKIYVARDTNKTYRWSGSAYIEISPSDVNSVAGLTGVISTASLKSALALNNVNNTSDLNKPVSTAQQTALDLKANDSLVVHLAGTETMTGAKTINTSASTFPLKLSNMGSFTAQLEIRNTSTTTNNGTYSAIDFYSGSGATAGDKLQVGQFFDKSGFIYNAANAPIDFYTSGTKRFTVNSTQSTFTTPVSAANAVANTDLVALGQLSDNILSSATTLSLATTSRVMYYSYTGSTATIWTLPTIAGNTKTRFVLINTGTGTITLNANGGTNNIWDSGALVNTISLTPGSSMELFNNGVSFIIL